MVLVIPSECTLAGMLLRWSLDLIKREDLNVMSIVHIIGKTPATAKGTPTYVMMLPAKSLEFSDEDMARRDNNVEDGGCRRNWKCEGSSRAHFIIRMIVSR